MMSKMLQTSATDTEFWNDSCDPDQLTEAIEHGAVGATSNPVIMHTALQAHPKLLGHELDRLIADHPTATEEDIAWLLMTQLTAGSATLLKPAFDRSGGVAGRLAFQVNPTYYRDAERMIAQARLLATAAPNLTIKIPATEAGLTAMEELTAEGVTVTATVCYSVPQAVACADAMERGLARFGSPMQPFVAIMVGRLDDHLKRVMDAEGITIDPGFLEWAGVATFKKTYGLFQTRGYRAKLISAAYRNHMQWSEFIGGKVVLAMPYKWWNRFNASDIEVRPRIDDPVADRVVDALRNYFEDFRRAYDENGMQPHDFALFGASVHTLNQFTGAYMDLLGLVRDRMFGI